MAKSKIDWCDYVWNPVTGCEKIAAGCINCYAEKMAARLVAMNAPGYNDNVINVFGKWTGKVNLLPQRFHDPMKWKKPGMVFVNSMSDLFHREIPTEFIEDVFEIMAKKAVHHIYIVLTKRPARMRYFMHHHKEFVRDNIWLGVSVSTQADVNRMVPLLCTTSAGKRIVSVEPMLEKVNLWIDHGQGVGDLILDNLDWVIAGCESGAKRRHVTIDAFRHLRDQCKEPTTRYPFGVPFFLKQMEIGGKVVHMPLLDGKIWSEKPL